ncbi:MAG: hypothetical protein GY826_33395 [Fuerstiella sp.]|nr:hypothetical protein [Fuerstiella sp.]
MLALLDNVEELKPLAYARRWWLPRRHNNRPVSSSTVNRYARHGVLGVTLEVVFTTDGAVTSESACKAFLAEVDRVRREEIASTSGDAP